MTAGKTLSFCKVRNTVQRSNLVVESVEFEITRELARGQVQEADGLVLRRELCPQGTKAFR